MYCGLDCTSFALGRNKLPNETHVNLEMQSLKKQVNLLTFAVGTSKGFTSKEKITKTTRKGDRNIVVKRRNTENIWATH